MTEAAVPSAELIVISGLLAVGLALIHLFSGRLRLLRAAPRSRWLSSGGGVSVAYVFVHVLPDLSEAQTTVRESLSAELTFLEHHVYLLALLGLAVFYGLERAAKLSRRQNQVMDNRDVTSDEVFWLHITSFGLYNALIGYLLLHREVPAVTDLLLFAIAMSLHFMVNDYGLRSHHKYMYDRSGRWILAAAVIAGWAIGSGTVLTNTAAPSWSVGTAILYSFLAGSIMLNVLKEELPEEHDSCFWCFTLGAAGYTALLLML